METRTLKLNLDPSRILGVLGTRPGFFLFESSLRHKRRGRYSFAGFDPFLMIEGRGLDDFGKLKKTFRRYSGQVRNKKTPFFSGIAGYLGYDLGRKFEGLAERRKSPMPDFVFGFYDRVITFDHLKKSVIISAMDIFGPAETRLRLEQTTGLLEGLSRQKFPERHSVPKPFAVRSDFTRFGYCKAVEKALNYIKAGDIYQVNLAQEFLCRYKKPVDAPGVYCALRRISPSCFGGYFNFGEGQIVSSSPELFMRLVDGAAETRPMKGTSGRGKSLSEDRRRAARLRHNAKEKAELLMVTDLERNDLGRVCRYGSVCVRSLRDIEKYATVFQATSTVAGRLAEGKTGFDLLKAAFPSGSVTGCPKIRAMQIIDELEPSARGPYTGGLGYMSFSGDMQFNVLIRTHLIKGRTVRFHAGSGIVADSDPDAEYEESMIKAKALMESLKYA